MEKYYSRNEFELLYNQLQQGFNCLETSSTGRILDAVSVLLGFSKNERKEKHGPTYALEKNSTTPYLDLKPKITKDATGQYILDTSYVINYVINYLHKKDKKRLAATVQLYLAEGLHEIIQKDKPIPLPCNQGRCPVIGTEGLGTTPNVFFSGGLAQNKIISNYLESRGAYAAKTIPPGDAGLSFGQVVWHLLS
jgi:hydrogenase maturation protein HypF